MNFNLSLKLLIEISVSYMNLNCDNLFLNKIEEIFDNFIDYKV